MPESCVIRIGSARTRVCHKPNSINAVYDLHWNAPGKDNKKAGQRSTQRAEAHDAMADAVILAAEQFRIENPNTEMPLCLMEFYKDWRKGKNTPLEQRTIEVDPRLEWYPTEQEMEKWNESYREAKDWKERAMLRYKWRRSACGDAPRDELRKSFHTTRLLFAKARQMDAELAGQNIIVPGVDPKTKEGAIKLLEADAKNLIDIPSELWTKALQMKATKIAVAKLCEIEKIPAEDLEKGDLMALGAITDIIAKLTKESALSLPKGQEAESKKLHVSVVTGNIVIPPREPLPVGKTIDLP